VLWWQNSLDWLTK